MKLKTEKHIKYLALNLKEFLKSIGMNQTQLAKVTKISASFINDIVKKRRYLPKHLKTFLESRSPHENK